jgi:uncharacterized membrane protein YedE/YeeE
MSRDNPAVVGFGAMLAGFVFALGLGISGMTNPDNVLAFLDLTGAWKPALALVMIGAIGVHAIGWRVARGRAAPVLADRFVLSTRTGIDSALLAGAAIFGVGWGLAGYCPGPAIVDVASGSSSTLIFVAAMLVGSALTDRLVAPIFRRTSRPKSSDDPISTQGVPE